MYFDMKNFLYEGIVGNQGGYQRWYEYQNLEIKGRYTKLVSKYSSDSAGLEKYHKIPLTPTGSCKTGSYP